jgi:hypothetical protein
MPQITAYFACRAEVYGSPWKWGLVPAEGFEPPTYGLQNRCTTTVLSRQIMTYGALISCHSVRESPPLPFILPKAGCRSAYHPSKERVHEQVTEE